MAKITELATETKEQIIALALQPDTNNDYDSETNTTALTALRQRLYSLFVNKELYSLAIPSYFRVHELKVIVDDNSEARRLCIDGTCTHTTTPPNGQVHDCSHIAAGTFSEHAIFYDNTIKLRVEIKDLRAVGLACEILSQCKRIRTVTVCFHHLYYLRQDQLDDFHRRLRAAIEQAKKIGEAREVKLEIEAKEDCTAEIKRPTVFRRTTGAIGCYA